MVDTGAEFSIIPASLHDRRGPQPTEALVAANGTQVPVFGRRNITVSFGNRCFSHEFLIADVTKSLLGVDFLNKYNIGVDTKGKRMFDLSNGQWFGGTGDGTICSLGATTSSSPYSSLLAEFPSIVKPSFNSNKVQHGVSHYIPTTCPPIRSRPRRLDELKLACAKKEFDKLLAAGIIRRSNSPWSSPLHCVPKPNGDWRPCGDYRRLNEATEDDTYQLPLISDFTARLKGKTVFSKVDLAKAYHQIPMDEAHIPKTAIVTPFGTFEFLRMPFGLKNSAQAFQRLMDSIFGSVPFVFVYLDDVLIASSSHEEHLEHLRTVFTLLQENGLFVNKDKCLLGVPSLDFLGHSVSAEGIRPLKSRVEAITSFPKPATKRNLQSFLGMVNFYHRFLPNIAETLIQYC